MKSGLTLNKKTHDFVNDNVWYVLSSKATLKLTFTLKQNCGYATKTRKITKNGTVCASLRSSTTSWKHCYLPTGNITLNGLPT